ncbi:MAG: HTTM domain-containing protein, partial [Flavobacteriaceae bacterium]|nr:HTTM domain-containing protein [Flavobacteriaceae bacterium]
FFFEPKTIHKIFLKKKGFYDKNEVIIPKYKPVLLVFLTVYFAIQLLLPLRHWIIKDDVLWTEEGHRLSWRMMLRAKAGSQTFVVVDKATGKKELVNLSDYLTTKQIRSVGTKPDFIWQFAQYLKKNYAKSDKDIAVYVKGVVSVNGKSSLPLVNDKIDMAAVKWNHFKHSEWLLPSKK